MLTDNQLCDLIARVIRRADNGTLTDDIPIAMDTPLLEAGHLDSLTIVELVSAIEAACGVIIPDNRMTASTFRTLAALQTILQGLKVGTE